MVEPLKSREYFDRVFVELRAPTWPNGFDLDPINPYMQLRAAGALTSAAAEQKDTRGSAQCAPPSRLTHGRPPHVERALYYCPPTLRASA